MEFGNEERLGGCGDKYREVGDSADVRLCELVLEAVDITSCRDSLVVERGPFWI